jgi:hypothetical protein
MSRNEFRVMTPPSSSALSAAKGLIQIPRLRLGTSTSPEDWGGEDGATGVARPRR